MPAAAEQKDNFSRKYMDSKKGFVPLVRIILLVMLVGSVGYFVATKKRPAPVVPSQETTRRAQTAHPTAIPDQRSPMNEIANWKLYRNEEYGFEFRYPDDMRLHVEREPKLTILESRDSRRHRVIDIAESVGLYKTADPNALFRVRVVGANKSIILDDGITWMTRFDCGTFSSGLSKVAIAPFMGYQAVKVVSLLEVFGGGKPSIVGEFFQYCVHYPLSPLIIDFYSDRGEKSTIGELIFSTFKFIKQKTQSNATAPS